MLLVLLGLMASAGVASVVIDHYDDDEANSAETVTGSENAAARADTSGVDMASGGGVESAGGTEGASGTAQPAEEEVTAPEDEADAAEEGASAEDEGTETAADEAPDPIVAESPAPEVMCGETVSYEQLVAAETSGERLTLGGGDDYVDATPPGGPFSDLHVEVELDLGGGDDTVVGPFWGASIDGGSGDDVFDVDKTGDELLTIDGGEGNDTIDVNDSFDVDVHGGAGDDVIHSRGRSWVATEYQINVNGGEGNDTLHVDGVSEFSDRGLIQAGAINGGDGTDHFVVAVNDEVDEIFDFDTPPEHLEKDTGTGLRSSVVELGDFDPATETLELHISSPNEAFEPASVHIEEDGVVVTYQSDIYPDLEMLISCDTEGLTADQVTLVGADPSLLVTEDCPEEEDTSGAVVDFEQLVAAEIAGEGLTLGDGDDFVDAMPPGGLCSDLHVELDIDLGGGDDTIVGPLIGSNLSGGAGDDLFEVEETYGEILAIDGGEGNDTIDARTSSNAILEGGAGDDVIHASGASSTGDGYVTLVDGGAGSDTLHFHAETEFAGGGFNPGGAINGGDGIDHFVVAVNDEVHELFDFDAPPEHLEKDVGTDLRSSVVELGDFDPAEETLELHISSPNENFEPTSVHIVEDGVVVTYQSEIYPDLKMLISCDTEGLTPDQVTLVVVDPSILVGAPASPVVCV